MKVVKLVEEQRQNTSTPADDSDLVLAVGANETWEFTYVIRAQGNGDRDIRIAMGVPTGATVYWTGIGLPDNATSETSHGALVITRSGTDVGNFATFLSTSTSIVVHGVVISGENGGSLALQWSQRNSGTHPISVLPGSFIRASKNP